MERARAVAGAGDLPQEPRRSGRARRKPRGFGSAEGDEVRPSAMASAKAKAVDAEPEPAAPPRPSLKRKAALDTFDRPDDLLDASLGPWQPGELETWASWVQVESEPVRLSPTPTSCHGVS